MQGEAVAYGRKAVAHAVPRSSTWEEGGGRNRAGGAHRVRRTRRRSCGDGEQATVGAATRVVEKRREKVGFDLGIRRLKH